jgi:hypothetical protein
MNESAIELCNNNLLNDVHLYPHVPTAANTAAFNANSTFASSCTIYALFPPNSKRLLANLDATFAAIIFPT